MKRVSPWQIWTADLDPTVGHEQAGIRPVLIVGSRVHGGRAWALATIVALTTRHRPELAFRVPVQVPGSAASSYAITEQIRTVSHDRLGRLLGRVDDLETIAMIRQALRDMIDI